MDDAPNVGVADHVVTVNDQVAEGDDLIGVGNLSGQCGIGFADAIEGFADDLEIPFDAAAQETIAKVVGLGDPVRDLLDQFGCLPNIIKPLETLGFHRRPPFASCRPLDERGGFAGPTA